MSSDVTESARFYELLAWMELNKKRLLTGVLVIVVIALGITYYFWQKNQREIEANAALLKLGLPLQRVEDSTGPSPTAYLKVAGDYPSTQAGQRAILLAAGGLFAEDKYAEALVQFRKFQNEYGSSHLAPIALMGIASCLDAQNQTEEAIQAYQTVLNRNSKSPEAAQARLALGLLYEAKKQPELALKEYDEVKRLNPQSLWGSSATERREQLLLKHPSLARTHVASTNLASANVANTNLASTKGATTNAAKTNAAITNRPVPKPVEATVQPKPTNAPIPGRTNAISPGKTNAPSPAQAKSPSGDEPSPLPVGKTDAPAKSTP